MVNGKNVITVDGRKIADGNTVFIPWSPTEETKVYHWNDQGGTTTWTLPESWAVRPRSSCSSWTTRAAPR